MAGGMYVCLCNGVTDRQLVEAAAELALESGAGSASSLARRTADRLGAGLGCGACRDFAIDLVEQAAAEHALPEHGRASPGLALPAEPGVMWGMTWKAAREAGRPAASGAPRCPEGSGPPRA